MTGQRAVRRPTTAGVADVTGCSAEALLVSGVVVLPAAALLGRWSAIR